MHIALFTTLPSLIENKRIETEVKNLGHSFELVDLSSFGFTIINGKLSLETQLKGKPDIVIVRGIFASIKPISNYIEELRGRGVRVFDNNLLAHQYSIDKVADLVKLANSGVLVPNTFYTRDFEDFSKAIEKIGFPMIIKSTRMGKGAGIVKVENEVELASLISELESDGREAKGYVIQEFIDYKFDLRILTIGESMYAMRRIPKAGEFRANFSLGGSVEIYELNDEERTIAQKAMSAVDLQIGGVDMLITAENRRFILEVNHTAGMVGMEEATKENITRKYVEYAIEHAK